MLVARVSQRSWQVLVGSLGLMVCSGGALLAQRLPALEAAALGVCLHGAAADQAAAGGERGLLAADLFPALRALLD